MSDSVIGSGVSKSCTTSLYGAVPELMSLKTQISGWSPKVRYPVLLEIEVPQLGSVQPVPLATVMLVAVTFRTPSSSALGHVATPGLKNTVQMVSLTNPVPARPGTARETVEIPPLTWNSNSRSEPDARLGLKPKLVVAPTVFAVIKFTSGVGAVVNEPASRSYEKFWNVSVLTVHGSYVSLGVAVSDPVAPAMRLLLGGEVEHAQASAGA